MLWFFFSNKIRAVEWIKYKACFFSVSNDSFYSDGVSEKKNTIFYPCLIWRAFFYFSGQRTLWVKNFFKVIILPILTFCLYLRKRIFFCCWKSFLTLQMKSETFFFQNIHVFINKIKHSERRSFFCIYSN